MRILITGGAGYVGSMLYSILLRESQLNEVVILDTWLYRTEYWAGDMFNRDKDGIPNGDGMIKGDIRDEETFRNAVEGCDVVIHLACISNDPSFDLNPDLGKSVNLDCLPMILGVSKESGVRHFIYASSSSVYGAKPPEQWTITEQAKLDPLTDYSLYKMMGEELVMDARDDGFAVTILRPATVCGRSVRQRLDLVHNIFARNAADKGVVKVFGGSQYRPGIHINDMCRLYAQIARTGVDDPERVDAKIWNAGWENKTVRDIADMSRDVAMEILDRDIVVETEESDDNRSYRVSSTKLTRELGFVPHHSVRDAMVQIAHWVGNHENPSIFDDPVYHNVKMVERNGVGI